jgi:hypothetical protein
MSVPPRASGWCANTILKHTEQACKVWISASMSALVAELILQGLSLYVYGSFVHVAASNHIYHTHSEPWSSLHDQDVSCTSEH